MHRKKHSLRLVAMITLIGMLLGSLSGCSIPEELDISIDPFFEDLLHFDKLEISFDSLLENFSLPEKLDINFDSLFDEFSIPEHLDVDIASLFNGGMKTVYVPTTMKYYAINDGNSELWLEASLDWDENGNLTSLQYEDIVDGGKESLQLYYDEYGNCVGSSESISQVNYTYDKFGNVIKAEVDGVTTQYTYDSRGNLKNTSQNGTEGVAYEYDAKGNMVLQTGNDVTIRYTYGTGNQLQEKTKTFVDMEFSCQYEYDSRGRVTRELLRVADEEMEIFAVSYDSNNCVRMIQVSTEFTDQFNYAADEMRIEFLYIAN